VVVDDWEAAEEVEEEKERVASGASGDEDGYVSTDASAKATEAPASSQLPESIAEEQVISNPEAKPEAVAVEAPTGEQPTKPEIEVGDGESTDWATAVEESMK